MQRSNTARDRRLWQQDTTRISAREREVQELKSTTIARTQSERTRPEDNSNGLYGSIAPRRTNTTRAPAKSYHNIPQKSPNYF